MRTIDLDAPCVGETYVRVATGRRCEVVDVCDTVTVRWLDSTYVSEHTVALDAFREQYAWREGLIGLGQPDCIFLRPQAG